MTPTLKDFELSFIVLLGLLSPSAQKEITEALLKQWHTKRTPYTLNLLDLVHEVVGEVPTEPLSAYVGVSHDLYD